MSKDTVRQLANALSSGFGLDRKYPGLCATTQRTELPVKSRIVSRFSFVPAGYVFAIWFIIFVSWIRLCHLPVFTRAEGKPPPAKAGYWFALSGVFNAGPGLFLLALQPVRG